MTCNNCHINAGQRERSLPAIYRELDLSETAVRRWLGQAAVDAGERDGLTTEEREELRRLRRENRVLRQEPDILKRAAAYFLCDGDPMSWYRCWHPVGRPV